LVKKNLRVASSSIVYAFELGKILSLAVPFQKIHFLALA